VNGSANLRLRRRPKTAADERSARRDRDYDMRNGRTTAWLSGMSKTAALTAAPGGVSVRPAGLADLEAVMALATAFYTEEGLTTPVDELRANLKSLLSSEVARTAAAVMNRELVAFAITTTSFGLESGLIAELQDLYVAPAARRQGIAGRMIDDSARWARLRGCRYLELVVAPNGRDVNQLDAYYRYRGFHDDGRRLIARHL
jgi:aminoglycoside 6'-N-acetyltransferase I